MLQLLAGPYDPHTRMLTRADGPVRLSPMEARLLAHLAAQPGHTFTKEALLTEVWGYKPGVRSRTLFSTMDRLRKKVEVDPAHPDHLHTTDGGYAFIDRAPLHLSTDLVGRRTDADTVARLLSEPRARVVLTGPGGVGKTRLAAELTTALVPARIPRAIRVDLAGIRAIDAAHHALARALALRGADAPARVARALEARAPMLLILDDLDHLADANPAATRQLLTLASAADVRVLATCRVDVSTEHITAHPLAPLTKAAALTLLARRAARVGVDPGTSADALDRLGTALDRLPLALELAAAWLPLLPPDALLARLDELVHLPDHGPRPAHHRSLQTCVTWSLDLLAPAHQEALTQLAHWTAPLPADAAARLLSNFGVSLAILADLRRRSLLQVDPDGTVRVLATVRRIVHHRHPTPRRTQPLVAWLDHLLERARSDRHTPRHATIMGTLDNAAPLVLEVLDAMSPGPERARRIAAWMPIQVRLGPEPHAAQRVGAGIHEAAGFPLLVAELTLARHWLDRRLGRPDPDALALLAQTLPTDHPLGVEVALEWGIVLRMTGTPDRARQVLDAAMDHPSATPVQLDRLRIERATLARRQGRSTDARRLLEDAAAHARTRADPWTRMLAAGSLGSVARQAGAWLEAETHQRRALELARGLREWDNVAHLNGNLANVLMAVGQHAEALRIIRTARDHYRSHGHVRSEAYALQTEAALRLFQGHPTHAAQLAEEALEGFRAAEDTHGIAYVSAFLVAVTLAAGEDRTALHRAQNTLQSLPDRTANGPLVALGAIAATLAGTPDSALEQRAHQRLADQPRAEPLRQALADAPADAHGVRARLRDPAWLHRALW